jgi:hypothetical protein
VQGLLRNEKLSFHIETECAHCHAPLHIDIDSELNYQVMDQEAQPLIFAPMVDFGKLKDPSIIDAF